MVEHVDRLLPQVLGTLSRGKDEGRARIDRPGSAMLIAGIRSPGKDGVFEGSSYTPGPFAVSAFDRDVVWIDGFFVTWPSTEAGS
jgi:hypothetical protein